MDDEVLDLSGLKCPLPALMTRRRYYAEGDAPFEISLSIHPGDRYAYTQRLLREGARK